jgi:hypothetical protein
MADKFDPYREALVVETSTIWPPELEVLPAEEKARIERQLHASPQDCQQLAYVRLPTGFCRKITVSADDVARSKTKTPPTEAPLE